MKTLNENTINQIMGKGLQILIKFCERNTSKDKDYNDLLDYLHEVAFNYYLELNDNEKTAKTILNCFYHAINILKLRHGILNNASKVDKSVTELNTVGGGVDNGEYTRVIKSKYKIDRHNYIDYQSIAVTYTNKSVRNAVLHGCFYVSIDNNEVLKNTLYSGLNPADELLKKEQTIKIKEVLKPMFNDVNFNKFELIIKSEKTNTDTERKIKNRFKNKYSFLKELEKNEIIYLINTYKA